MKNGRPDTFVITGDIDAMWLRDSSAQVWPYLPLMKKDKDLQLMVAGLVNRQTECILIDRMPMPSTTALGSYGTTIHNIWLRLHERNGDRFFVLSHSSGLSLLAIHGRHVCVR